MQWLLRRWGGGGGGVWEIPFGADEFDSQFLPKTEDLNGGWSAL